MTADVGARDADAHAMASREMEVAARRDAGDRGTGTSGRSPETAPDEREFTELYESAYPGIARYLLRRGAGERTADLAAEAFVVAWRQRAQWLGLPTGERTAWLYGVARNLLANAYRSERRGALLTDRIADDERVRHAGLVNDHGDAYVERRIVTDALAGLSEADQELIRLIAWDGLTPAQAATVLGIRATAVTSRLHRARKRLRKLIDTQTSKGTS